MWRDLSNRLVIRPAGSFSIWEMALQLFTLICKRPALSQFIKHFLTGSNYTKGNGKTKRMRWFWSKGRLCWTVYPNNYMYLSSLNGCVSYWADFDSDRPVLIRNTECFCNLFSVDSTLPAPKPSCIYTYASPVSTKEVGTFLAKPPNILAQPAVLMGALKGHRLKPVPRGHTKAKVVGMDLCGGSCYSCLHCPLPEDK